MVIYDPMKVLSFLLAILLVPPMPFICLFFSVETLFSCPQSFYAVMCYSSISPVKLPNHNDYIHNNH